MLNEWTHVEILQVHQVVYLFIYLFILIHSLICIIIVILFFQGGVVLCAPFNTTQVHWKYMPLQTP